jgi:hypothetical protein
VAALAIGGPPRVDVIRVFGLLQVVLMARVTLDGCTGEVADLGAGMAPEASGGCVSSGERESCSVVLRDLAFGYPISLGVTCRTAFSQLAAMDVLMAAGASTFRERRDRSAIVVAAQALGRRVRADEGDAGFAFVVEREVGANLRPGPLLVADRAIGGERLVRDHGSALRVPALASRGGPAREEITHT